MTNGKLSTFQMVMLISISRLFAFYIYLPIVSTPPANQDVWIVCLVSGILDIFVCFPMIYLASKFQNMSLLDYYKLIIGKVPSFIWGIILALFFLFNVIIAFNLISLFLGTVVGHQLMAENRTRSVFLLNFIAMIVNVVLNLVFIPKLGLIGAAVATLIAYTTIPLIMLFLPKKDNSDLVPKNLNLINS